MPRPKLFSRQEVLVKSLELFWKRGFSDTSIQDLEKATGVNKSGLYSEFKNKDEIYSEALKLYIEMGYRQMSLFDEPKGFRNIERFLTKEGASICEGSPKGCFAINATREVLITPKSCRNTLETHLKTVKSLISENLIAESVDHQMASELADLILTFHAGLCLEQNIDSPEQSKEKTVAFIKLIRKQIQKVS